MPRSSSREVFLCLTTLGSVLLSDSVQAQSATGSAFTYQGRLNDAGSAAGGKYDLQFTLFDAAERGRAVAEVVGLEDVEVKNGLFTVELDFGKAAFDGKARFLEVAVRPGDDQGEYTKLEPRQPLTPAPYALYALNGPGSGSADKPGPKPRAWGDHWTGVGTGLILESSDYLALSVSTLGAGYHAIYGRAADTGDGAGVAGWTNSFEGFGVKGGGNHIGVDGSAYHIGVNGEGGSVGVKGTAVQVTGTTYGVAGYGNSSLGAGVFGSAPGIGVEGETDSSSGTGVRGLASASGGVTVGVHGETHSNIGNGVFGEAKCLSGSSCGSGAGIGVMGYSLWSGGRGVLGKATAASGTTYGVYGMSISPAGTGTYGAATDPNGPNFGVYGYSASKIGTGVYGGATSTLGRNYGVIGGSASNEGVGVLGQASSPTGQTSGVVGEALSPDGKGVVARATATMGVNSGVFATAAGNAGRAVYGSATASGGTTYGVLAENNSSSGRGVYAAAFSPSGTTYGVWGRSYSTGGTGVYGYASATSGITYGVYGVSQSPIGRAVYAWNTTTGPALFAQSTSGNPVEAYGASTADREFYVSNTGNVYTDGAYNCGLASGCFNSGAGADLAERIDVTEALQPGDVVGIDPSHPEHFNRAATPYSTLVAGVVSTQPAMTMNNSDLANNDKGVRTDTRPLLALVGQVPVKASAENGPIRLGDLLVASSTPGHAMAAGKSPPPGSILGKALQELDKGTGTIRMLVTLQ